jgi:hypothetical protein
MRVLTPSRINGFLAAASEPMLPLIAHILSAFWGASFLVTKFLVLLWSGLSGCFRGGNSVMP